MYKMHMNIAGPFFLLGYIGIRKVKEGHNISTLPALLIYIMSILKMDE